jgi:vacuolar-type H+-ATPase subunit E/Vma4
MGVEELRVALQERGQMRVAEILAEAEAGARRLREAARQEAARRRNEQLRRAEEQLREEARGRVAAARREARRRVLVAREAFLERLFERLAGELARTLGEPVGQAWIADRAREALAFLPEGPLRFMASPSVTPCLADALAGHDRVRIETDPELPAGFVASDPDGRLSVDATLPRWIEHERSQLAIEALRRLAASGPADSPP